MYVSRRELKNPANGQQARQRIGADSWKSDVGSEGTCELDINFYMLETTVVSLFSMFVRRSSWIMLVEACGREAGEHLCYFTIFLIESRRQESNRSA